MNNNIPVIITNDQQNFPDPCLALKDPDGLLAIGGRLSSKILAKAYKAGIFPWFNEGDPLLWWSPSTRTLLHPKNFKLQRSLKQSLKKNIIITVDCQFEAVINKCSQLRENKDGTWITKQMLEAYIELHNLGICHSIEVWHQKKLVGGLYGISLGQAFFGESMFHEQSNASKIALLALCNLSLPFAFDFIDCQMPSKHLHSLGAKNYSRENFILNLNKTLLKPDLIGTWILEPISGFELLNTITCQKH